MSRAAEYLQVTSRTQAAIKGIDDLAKATADEDPSQWTLGAVKAARETLVGQVVQDLEANANKLKEWSTSAMATADAASWIEALEKATAPAVNPAKLLKRNLVQIGLDVCRILASFAGWLLAIKNFAFLDGWLPILVADLVLAILLAAVIVRSDETYKRRATGENIGAKPGKLYDFYWVVVPTKLVAIFVVAGLFFSLWLGFAKLYQRRIDQTPLVVCVASVPGANAGDPAKVVKHPPECRPDEQKELTPFTLDDAKDLSFLTLATFDGPNDNYPQLRSTVLCELGHAILLILGIFAILVNRLSDWASPDDDDE